MRPIEFQILNSFNYIFNVRQSEIFVFVDDFLHWRMLLRLNSFKG